MFDAAAMPGTGQFLGVDWGAIALVTITTLLATVVIVPFALAVTGSGVLTVTVTGVRLLSQPVEGLITDT